MFRSLIVTDFDVMNLLKSLAAFDMIDLVLAGTNDQKLDLLCYLAVDVYECVRMLSNSYTVCSILQLWLNICILLGHTSRLHRRVYLFVYL